MKRLILFALATLNIALSVSVLGQNNTDILSANPSLTGKWVGTGKFLDKNLKDFGPVAFEININNDHTITVKIADATLN